MNRARAFGTVLMLVGVVLFASLGRWQLQRGEWKTRLIAAHAAARVAAPRDLAAVVGAHAALPSRADLPDAAAATNDAPSLPMRVQGTGEYDAGATVLLDNQLRDGVGGAFVFTVFHPQGSARAVLVNRGWLPLGDAHRAPALTTPPSGPTAVAGMLVAPPSVGLRLGSAAFARGASPPLLTYLDLDALRAATGTALFAGVLQLDAQYDGGYARDFPVLPNTLPPERHRGYAVQWFGLALAVAIVWLVLMRRRSPKPTSPEP